MIVWYSVGSLGLTRYGLDLGDTPYNLRNPREQAEVLELAAADYHRQYTAKFPRFSPAWPLWLQLYDANLASTPPLVSMSVDMELQPSFTAYVHTATGSPA